MRHGLSIVRHVAAHCGENETTSSHATARGTATQRSASAVNEPLELNTQRNSYTARKSTAVIRPSLIHQIQWLMPIRLILSKVV